MGSAEFVTLVSFLLALNALAIDTMLPAFDAVRSHFGMTPDSTAAARIVTVYFLGSSLQVVHGPFSDRLGRRPVLWAGLGMYGVGAVASVLAPSFGWMLAARLAWGFGGAALQVTGIAMVRDRFEGDRMARIMSLVMGVFAVVPVAAPLLGAAILSVASWQAVFLAPAVVAAAVGAWSWRLPETLPPGGRTPLDLAHVSASVRRVLGERQTVTHMLALTLVFGGFTSYLASSELIVGGIYRRPELFPPIFAGVAVIMGCVSFANGAAVRRWGAAVMVRFALGVQLAAGVGLTVLSAAWGGRPPFAPFLALLVTAVALFPALFSSLSALALEPMGELAGTASAVLGTTFVAGGALLGAVIDGQLVGTVTPLAVGVTAGATGALLLVRLATGGVRPPAVGS